MIYKKYETLSEEVHTFLCKNFSREKSVLPYNWKMDESEIIKIAAANDIKIIFEDSLSLKKDFMNYPLTIVLLHEGQMILENDISYESYSVLRNIDTYHKYIDNVEKIYQTWPEDEREEDFTESLMFEKEELSPYKYDEGIRIMNSFAAMNCINKYYDCAIYNQTLIDDSFIKKMKKEHNISIIVKESKEY